jgi:hypothetical protein
MAIWHALISMISVQIVGKYAPTGARRMASAPGASAIAFLATLGPIAPSLPAHQPSILTPLLIYV